MSTSKPPKKHPHPLPCSSKPSPNSVCPLAPPPFRQSFPSRPPRHKSSGIHLPSRIVILRETKDLSPANPTQRNATSLRPPRQSSSGIHLLPSLPLLCKEGKREGEAPFHLNTPPPSFMFQSLPWPGGLAEPCNRHRRKGGHSLLAS